jgi:hypothetical protein
MSEKMTRTSDMMPPPPMPWMLRPARKTTKLFAAQHRMVPMRKSSMAKHNMCCRPKISEREARNGWNMLLVRRYEVPAQNASLAVPLRELANV